MSPRRAWWFLVLFLVLLTLSLRLFHLGRWSFHTDELATISEVASFRAGVAASNSQIDRLPHVIPLSHWLLRVGFDLFGDDEFGSRALSALFGVAHVLLIFLFLDRSLGRVPAIATALLVALWPEHLYRSQEARFYTIVATFAAVAMLAGGLAVQRRSLLWTALGGGAAVLTILAHTLQAMLLGGLFLGILAAAVVSRDRRIARLLTVVVAAGCAGAALLALYVMPLVRGWNAGEDWGYTSAHGVLAAVSQLGWPLLLLAVLGAVAVWKNGTPQDWYWLTWAGLWLAASAVLPRLVAYHPAYVFPLALGVLVLAGRAIALVYEGLRARSALAAGCWVALACVLNLPGLVSHYCDGSRFDFRTPAQYVSAHFRPGDRVAAVSPKLFKHYVKPGIEPEGIKGSNPVPGLERLTRQPGRLWIVVPSSRGGLPENVRRWLGTHCSQELRQCGKRFDYYENATEVYLYEGPANPGPVWAQRD